MATTNTIYVVNLGYEYDSAELCDYDYLQNFTALHSGIHSDAFDEMLDKYKEYTDDYFWGVYEADRNYACDILREIEGEEYKWSFIQGCCQSDWDYVFYPANREEFLDDFKDIYFGYLTTYAIFTERPRINDGAIEWGFSECETETYLDHFGTLDEVIEDIAEIYGADEVVYYEGREVCKTIYEEKETYYVPQRTK